MSEFGGTGAQAIKDGIDSVFNDGGDLEILDFKYKLIGATADGASVNFGCVDGLLKKLERDDRPWLVKIHCANHRTELAVKDAFAGSDYQAVDTFYIGLFNLLKSSGAIKSDIKAAAQSLDICFYTLPKMTGTRFVSHRKKALTHLLDMWPAIITALENTLAARKHKHETKGKIIGFLKQLKSYAFLCLVCTFLDILEKITPTSLVFEGDGLLPHEVKPTVSLTVLELEDIIESAGTDDELLDSHLSRFQYSTDEEGETCLAAAFAKSGNMLKALGNREYKSIELEGFTGLNASSLLKASTTKKGVASQLITCLQTRFESFNDPVFESMKWFDPKNWTDESLYGYDQIDCLSQHFEGPLSKNNFNKQKVHSEWKRFKMFISVHYKRKLASGEISAKAIWRAVLLYRKSEFPNLSLLAQIIITISGSNSSVERSFSLLTSVLTDRRLKMTHKTLQMLIRIKCNDSVWSEEERNALIERATDIHMEARRKKKIDESPMKRIRLSEAESSSEESDCEDETDDEPSDFSE